MYLPPEDYVLGLFDMIGELMRFSITAMATAGEIPGTSTNSAERQERQDSQHPDEIMDFDESDTTTGQPSRDRSVLSDMRELRTYLETLEVTPGSFFARDVDKKMGVMRTCVEKVERGLYGLVVRGSERPKGWLPDLTAPREEVEGF